MFSCWKESPKNVALYCNNCERGAEVLHHRVSAIFQEQEQIKKDITDLKKQQNSIKVEFQDFKITTESKMRELDQQNTITSLETKISENL